MSTDLLPDVREALLHVRLHEEDHAALVAKSDQTGIDKPTLARRVLDYAAKRMADDYEPPAVPGGTRTRHIYLRMHEKELDAIDERVARRRDLLPDERVDRSKVVRRMMLYGIARMPANHVTAFETY